MKILLWEEDFGLTLSAGINLKGVEEKVGNNDTMSACMLKKGNMLLQR